jgi:polyhydroxyalkanoate synthesis regulator phasin
MEQSIINPAEIRSQFFDLIHMLIPVVTGAIGWLAGRRKQKNDFLSELQSSIDLLSEKNRRQMEEVLQLREENLMIRGEIAKLREENRTLRSEIKALNKDNS